MQGDVMPNEKTHDCIGPSFDEFLKEEGMHEEVESVAVKRVIAWELEQAMKSCHITKKAMAEKLKTSRSALDRLLDPNNPSISLPTILKVAAVLGKKVRLELEDAEPECDHAPG
jgi:hypothetical protein